MRYAVAAADYGSFRQAAVALNVKRSTLSRSILLPLVTQLPKPLFR
ncbi:LysR family transcriptional regulator [Bradyrhizobium sp. Tv2a-2]|nr:LysR family transcriptional regulator [Bradyrhizobium sp. Tv2a-2]